MSDILLDQLTARISHHRCLSNLSLCIAQDEHWTVVGANGSGKSALGKLLCGQLEIVSGSAQLPDKAALVSFEKVSDILNSERYKDESNISGGFDSGTTARNFLSTAQSAAQDHIDKLEELFQLNDLLDRGIKFLSTGELRKVLICQALLAEPHLLVLDEPFDGLDQSSCKLLKNLIEQIRNTGIQIVLLLNRFSEILPTVTHIAYLKDCRLVAAGTREQILKIVRHDQRSYQKSQPVTLNTVSPKTIPEKIPTDGPLIVMRQVNVHYANKQVIKNFNWTVRPGEHWMISGPNGSGKTTLLNLITGDNTQAYANDIKLFGRQKGTGESIWEIKQHIGHISTAFQRDYRVGGSALSVIISGFYDSIGVYHTPTQLQRDQAYAWLQRMKLERFAKKSFQGISFGHQRMLLLARAMVKNPQVLILDEPCQGLDDHNRTMILEMIDHIGTTGQTQLLYVTHHPEDQLFCINRHLQFIPTPTGYYETCITHL